MAFDDNSGEENENTVNKPAILKQLGQRLVDKVNQGSAGKMQEVYEGSSEDLETEIDRRGSNKLALS